MTVTIYHNPACGTSRNVLQFLRDAGIEPKIVEYLKTPPSRAEWRQLAERLGSVRELFRTKEPLYTELNLDAETRDDTLLDVLTEHPRLLNRPVVTTPWGTRVCRPSETVLELIAQR